MGLDNPNGTGRVLWIDTEQAEGHVAKIGRRLHRIAGLPTEVNSENVNIYLLREFQPVKRREIFDACLEIHRPDFVVLDGVSDLISDPNSSEQSTDIVNHLLAITKTYDCHLLTVIHANVGSEKARGHLGSEALRKCETAIYAKAEGDVTLCQWTKTRDMRPDDFAFKIDAGLPVSTNHVPNIEKEDKRSHIFKKITPIYPNTISYTELKNAYMDVAKVKDRAAERNIETATNDGIIIKSQVGRSYYLPPKDENMLTESPF